MPRRGVRVRRALRARGVRTGCPSRGRTARRRTKGTWANSSRWPSIATPRGAGAARPQAPLAGLLLRPRLAGDVPGRRAGRPPASPVVAWRRPCADALGAGRARSRSERGVPPSARAATLRLPLVWPERRPARRRAPCASRRSPASAAAAPPSCSPPAAWRSAAASTSTTPRCSPRPPRPPSLPLDDCLERRRTTRARRRDGGAAASACVALGADTLPAVRVGPLALQRRGAPRRGGRRRAARVAPRRRAPCTGGPRRWRLGHVQGRALTPLRSLRRLGPALPAGMLAVAVPARPRRGARAASGC